MSNQPVGAKPGGQPGGYGGVVLMAVLVVALIAYGIIEHPFKKDKKKVVATVTTLAPAATTTTSSVPVASTYASSLPATLPADFVPAKTTGATWVATGTDHAEAGAGSGVTPDPCVASPLATSSFDRQYQLNAAGSTAGTGLGQGVLTVREFSSAADATQWVQGHQGATFEACAKKADRAAVVSANSGNAVKTDGSSPFTGVEGGLLIHYSAAATVAGKTCQYYDDTYVNAVKALALTADFHTCGTPFPPLIMQTIVTNAISAIAH